MKNNIRCFYVLLYLCCVTGHRASAQEFPQLLFDNYSEADGLSSNEVHATLRDKKGFLWIATTNGLNRFDGYSFKTFLHIAQAIKMEPEARKQFYLLFKEATNNLARYACCTEASVDIRQEQEQFILEIRDNGVGFDPLLVAAGNGLRNMRSRAAALNGALDIESAAGRGTLVLFQAPLSNLGFT